MYNEVIKLIKETVSADSLGNPITTRTERQVFAMVHSIGQKEFYQAHAVGLQPEYKVVLADYLDYEGESLAEFQGQQMRVLRTYRSGKELEITLYREVNPA